MRVYDLRVELDQYPEDAEVSIDYHDEHGFTWTDPDFDIRYIPVTNEVRLT